MRSPKKLLVFVFWSFLISPVLFSPHFSSVFIWLWLLNLIHIFSLHFLTFEKNTPQFFIFSVMPWQHSALISSFIVKSSSELFLFFWLVTFHCSAQPKGERWTLKSVYTTYPLTTLNFRPLPNDLWNWNFGCNLIWTKLNDSCKKNWGQGPPPQKNNLNTFLQIFFLILNKGK